MQKREDKDLVQPRVRLRSSRDSAMDFLHRNPDLAQKFSIDQWKLQTPEQNEPLRKDGN